jgi:phosphate starvation-inducible protein PhoH and related proteins
MAKLFIRKLKMSKHEGSNFKPRTENQLALVRSICENPITIALGPAGCGKTSVSAAMAVSFYERQEIDKIIISRPAVEAGRGLGFLPGGMKEKFDPYIIPMLDELAQYMGSDVIQKMREDSRIEIVPLEYMRGRNFHKSFIILDEGSNATFQQLTLTISRIGRNSKLVINGDPNQTDLSDYDSGALEFVANRLEKATNVGVVKLGKEDIQRNKILGPIMGALKYEDFQTFQRSRRDKD